MAYLFRLIFTLLFFVTSSVFAFPPQTVKPNPDCTPSVFPPSYTQDPSVSSAWSICSGRGGWIYTSAAYGWTGTCKGPIFSPMCNAFVTVPAQCPSNSTINNGECTCNSGHKENSEGNACIVWTDFDEERSQCKLAAGIENTIGLSPGWDDAIVPGLAESGKIICFPTPNLPPGRGCTVEFQRDVSYQNKGKWTSEGTIRRDWDSDLPCSLVPDQDGQSNDAPVPATPGKACPFGQPGQINGVDVCVPIKEDSKTESRKVTQDEKILPDGSKEVTTTTTTTNCKDRMCMTVTDKKVSSTPGSVTNPAPGGGGPEVPPGGKKLPDGSVWSPTGPTTTTGAGSMGGAGGVTPPAGAASGAGSNTGSAGVLTESKSDFCTKSPKDKQCGQEGDGQSGFGGSCKAGFKCDGDAVTCAIAQEAHKRNCQLFETESDERTAYLADLAKGKEGKDNSKDLKGNIERTFSSADFDTSDALGGGACIGDKTITVMGETIVLPFSMICQILSYMGMVLVGVSYLLAARILIRG